MNNQKKRLKIVFNSPVILWFSIICLLALILLSSFTSIKEGTIPLTFILVALIYIGGQAYDGIFIKDNVSNLIHILGGAVGARIRLLYE